MDTEAMSEQYAALMESSLTGIEMFAENTEEAQWSLACSVVHTEEERAAVMEAAKKGKYSLVRQGSSFSLSRNDSDETSIIEELITEGKATPYTKGPGGEVQELDGSTSESHSKAAGVPLPWYAWDAVPVEENVNTILKDTIPEMFRDAANQCSSAFGNEVVRPWVAEQLSQLGGGS